MCVCINTHTHHEMLTNIMLRNTDTHTHARTHVHTHTHPPHVLQEVHLCLVLDLKLCQLVIEVGPHGGIGAASEGPLLRGEGGGRKREERGKNKTRCFDNTKTTHNIYICIPYTCNSQRIQFPTKLGVHRTSSTVLPMAWFHWHGFTAQQLWMVSRHKCCLH